MFLPFGLTVFVDEFIDLFIEVRKLWVSAVGCLDVVSVFVISLTASVGRAFKVLGILPAGMKRFDAF